MPAADQRAGCGWATCAPPSTSGWLRRGGLAAAIGEAHLYRTVADAAPDLRGALDA